VGGVEARRPPGVPAHGRARCAHQRILRGARVPPAVRHGWLGHRPPPPARDRPGRTPPPPDPGAPRPVGAGAYRGPAEGLGPRGEPDPPSGRRRRRAVLPPGGPDPARAVPQEPRPGHAVTPAGRTSLPTRRPSRLGSGFDGTRRAAGADPRAEGGPG